MKSKITYPIVNWIENDGTKRDVKKKKKILKTLGYLNLTINLTSTLP